jgi:hypothetical protein
MFTVKPEPYHWKLHDIEPWRRREVARNTGRKCEHREYPPSLKRAQTRRDRQRRKRELRVLIQENF